MSELEGAPDFIPLDPQPAGLSSLFAGGYGNREDGTKKGNGYFGPLKMTDGSDRVATEISIGVNIDGKDVQIPTLVPTLTPEEKSYLLSGGDPRKNQSIVSKAVEHARSRSANNQPVFSADANAVLPDEIPLNLPKAKPMGAPKPSPVKPTQSFSLGGDTVDAVALGHWNTVKQGAMNDLAKVTQEASLDEAGGIDDTYETGKMTGGMSGGMGFKPVKVDRLLRSARRAEKLLQIKRSMVEADLGIEANTRRDPGDPNMVSHIFQGAEPMAYALAPQLGLSAVDFFSGGLAAPATIPLHIAAAGASGGVMGNQAYNVVQAEALKQYGADKGIDITSEKGMKIAMSDPDFVSYRDRLAMKIGAVSAVGGTALGLLPGGAQALTKAATGRALAQSALTPAAQGLASSAAGQIAGLGTAVTIGAGQQVGTNYMSGKPLGEGVADTATMFAVQDALFRTIHAGGGRAAQYYREKMAGTNVGAPGAGSDPGPQVGSGGKPSGPSTLNQWQLEALIAQGMPANLHPEQQVTWIKSNRAKVQKAFADLAAREDARRASAGQEQAQPAPTATVEPSTPAEGEKPVAGPRAPSVRAEGTAVAETLPDFIPLGSTHEANTRGVTQSTNEQPSTTNDQPVLSARDEPSSGNNTVPREALKPTRSGFELVEVDPKLINDEHQRSSPGESVRNPGNELSRGGVTRTQRAKEYIQAGDYRGAEPAELGYSDSGKLSITNGRHRLKAAEELGARSTFVSVPKAQAKQISDQFGPKGMVESARDDAGYRGSHKAPDGTSGEGSLDAMDRTYPDDIYGPNGAKYYGARRSDDVQMHRLIQSVRGNPEAEVSVFRAVPKGSTSSINPGDWVTPSKAYASDHGQRFDGGFDIIEQKVKAGDLYTEGNSLHEFGWSPKGDVAQSARDAEPAGQQGYTEQELRQADKNSKPSSVTNYDVSYEFTNEKGKPQSKVTSVQADSGAEAKRKVEAKIVKDGVTDYKMGDAKLVSQFPMVGLQGNAPKIGQKVTQTPDTPEKWQNLFDNVDRARAYSLTLPDLGLSENWSKVISLSIPGGTGDLPPAPLRLHKWATDPAAFKSFFDEANGKNPELIRSAVSGLGSLDPVHAVAMKGQLPTRMVALHFMWGALSKMLGPFEQEAGWIKLTNSPEILRAIDQSVAGTFNLTREEWMKLTGDAIRLGPELKAGNNSISNANAFHLTLTKWNGKWDQLTAIINNPKLSGPQMRREIYKSGLGSGSGFGFKVLSFNLLTLARRDMFIGDRWQFVNLWFPHLELTAGPDGVFSYNKNGIPEDTTRAYASLNTLDKESSAEAVYSLIESGLQKVADDARSWLEPILGRRPLASDIHWLSWNIIKNEPVGHSSLDSSTRALQEGLYEKTDFPQTFPALDKSTEQYTGDGSYRVFGGNRDRIGYSERRSAEGDAGLRPANPEADAGGSEAGPARSARDESPATVRTEAEWAEVDRKAQELDRRQAARSQAQERNTNPETRRRGGEQIAQRLVNELRRGGNLSIEEATAALRIVESLIENGYLDNLSASVSKANPGEAVRGGYQPAKELVQIFVRNTNRPGVFKYTFAHEVAHHLERMVPAKDLEAARQQFLRERAKWLKDKKGLRELLGEGNWLDRSFTREQIHDFLAKNDMDVSLIGQYFIRDTNTGRWRIKRTDETYRLTNFSEYFADKVADIATARDDARTNPQDMPGVWSRMKAFFAQVKKSLMDIFGKDKVEKIWDKFQRGEYSPGFKREELHGYDRTGGQNPVKDNLTTADYRGRRMGPADAERQTRVDNIDNLEPNKPIPRTPSSRDDGENTPIPGGYREAFFLAKKGAGAPGPKQIKFWTDLGHDPDADQTKQFLWSIDRRGEMHVVSVSDLNDKMIASGMNDQGDVISGPSDGLSEWTRIPTHLDWANLAGEFDRTTGKDLGVPQFVLSGPAHGRIDATGDVLRVSLIQKNQSTPEIKADMQRHVKEKLGEALGEDPIGLRGYDFTDAGPFTGPEAFSARDEEPTQAPMSAEQRKSRIEEIKKEIAQITGGRVRLSREEGARYSKLGMELEGHRFDIRAGRGLKLELIKSEGERVSTIPSGIVKIAADELASNRAVFDALTEASLGVRFNQDTAVDVIMNGDNANISPSDLYSAFNKTRDALRQQFGDTIELYRAHGNQMQKATQNWHSTEAGAKEYGKNIERRSIPIDDVIALNVGLRGAYEEFVVGKNPSGEDVALSARDEETAGRQFVPVEQLFNEESAPIESLYSPTAKKNLPAGSTMEFGPLDEDQYGFDRSYGGPGPDANDHSAHEIIVRDKDGNEIASAHVIADRFHVFTKRPKYLDGKIQRNEPKLDEGWTMTVEMISGDNPRAQVAVAAEAVERAKMAGATMVIVPFKGWDQRDAVNELVGKLGADDIQINDELDALNIVFGQKTPDYASAEDGDAAYGIRRDRIYSARDEETAPQPPALPEVSTPKGGLLAAVAAMTPSVAEAATRSGAALSAVTNMDLVSAAAAIGLAGNDRILQGLNPIVANMHLLARDTKSPTILSVAEMFNRLGGNVAEGAQETYFEERDGNRRIFRNKLVEAFKPLAHLSDADLKALDQDIAMALAGEKTLTGAEGQVVANLQAFSDELFDYLREAGVKVNYAKDYGMPHSFNSEKVITNDQAFVADATRAYHLNNPMRIKRLTDYIQQIQNQAAARGGMTADMVERTDALNKEINELQNAKPADQAQALLGAIDTSNAGGDATQGLLLEAQGTGQNKADFTRERIFEPAARRILRDYFNNDPRHAWNSYIARATTLAEFSRRFGGDGSKWTDMVKQMRIEKVSNKDVTRIKNMVLDTLGVLNVAPTEGHALAVSVLGLSNMAKLKSTALTNFLEAQAQAIPGDLRQTITAPINMLGQFMAIVTELPPRQQAQLKKLIGMELSSETGSMELARAVGLIDAAGVHEMMENSAWNIESASDFSGATKTDKLARVTSHATGGLARTFGIEATENAKRAMAAKYASIRLDAHVSEFLRDGLFARAWDKLQQNNPNPGLNPFTLRNEARMRLRRAGVSDNQMIAFAQWWETARANDFNSAIKGNDPMAKLARKVIRMESARASVNTNRGMKPGGKENPLVSQDTFAGKAAMTFLNYPATFLQQIGKPMIRDVKTAARGYESEGGQSTHYSGYERTRMAARAFSIPAMAVSAAVFLAVRAWLSGHEDDVKAKPLWKHLLEGFTYTGMAGGKSEFASRASRGQLPPILDEGNRLVKDLNRNDDKKNGKERAVTGGVIRGGAVPVALGASAALIPMPAAVIVNQILASKDFREMATDFIAGPAAPKSQGQPGAREGGSDKGREGERRPGGR